MFFWTRLSNYVPYFKWKLDRKLLASLRIQQCWGKSTWWIYQFQHLLAIHRISSSHGLIHMGNILSFVNHLGLFLSLTHKVWTSLTLVSAFWAWFHVTHLRQSLHLWSLSPLKCFLRLHEKHQMMISLPFCKWIIDQALKTIGLFNRQENLMTFSLSTHL